ncbi:hypothetical protein Pcinc_032421 [Petrolisthes cinctipes]|uniref:Uncharacterized protein n=1 Tax=Petrolisthes cinctipes TaxID=88211 RepID=A0AAE1EUM0_PETCI|nr:hypothetical protein Pcinc_032421 [Petrolisthes cinctipes]
MEKEVDTVYQPTYNLTTPSQHNQQYLQLTTPITTQASQSVNTTIFTTSQPHHVTTIESQPYLQPHNPITSQPQHNQQYLQLTTPITTQASQSVNTTIFTTSQPHHVTTIFTTPQPHHVTTTGHHNSHRSTTSTTSIVVQALQITPREEPSFHKFYIIYRRLSHYKEHHESHRSTHHHTSHRSNPIHRLSHYKDPSFHTNHRIHTNHRRLSHHKEYQNRSHRSHTNHRKNKTLAIVQATTAIIVTPSIVSVTTRNTKIGAIVPHQPSSQPLQGAIVVTPSIVVTSTTTCLSHGWMMVVMVLTAVFLTFYTISGRALVSTKANTWTGKSSSGGDGTWAFFLSALPQTQQPQQQHLSPDLQHYPASPPPPQYQV